MPISPTLLGILAASKSAIEMQMVVDTHAFNWKYSTTTTYAGVAYGNGVWVAVGSDLVSWSTDGVNWNAGTPAGSPGTGYSFQNVTFGAGVFVAVCQGGATGNRIMYSADGNTWSWGTGTPVGDSGSYSDVSYGGGFFVAVKAGDSYTTQVATSVNGIAWSYSPTTVAADSQSFRSVACTSGKFVIFGNFGYLLTSTDAVTWTFTDLSASLGSMTFSRMIYGSGQFVLASQSDLGTNQFIITSPNGTTWTKRTTSVAGGYRAIAYGNGLYMIMNYSNSDGMYSTDAATWTSMAVPVASQQSWQGMAYANSKFVTVGALGTSSAFFNGTVPSSDVTFVLPTTGSGYNANLDWGDGNSQTLSGTPGNVSHTYASVGTYTLKIKENVVGGFPRCYFNNTGDCAKVTELRHWGTNTWTSMGYAFYGCGNMQITASDSATANTGSVTNFDGAFAGCVSLTSFPVIDTHAGTSFSSTWALCTGLTSFPTLNMAAATFVGAAWNGCKGLNGYAFPTMDWHLVNNLQFTFQGFGVSRASYNSILDQLANGRGGIVANTNTSVTFDAGTSHYDTSSGGYNGTAARAVLTGTRSWTINDGGP